MTDVRVVVSCEHGGHDVPGELARVFERHEALLASHRGWDAGALEAARRIADALGAPLVSTTISRLVVDCNRSESHPAVFSEITRALPAPERERLLATHHRPHRAEVERLVREASASAHVLHVAVHSFTPVWSGRERPTEVGLLHDPHRRPERALVEGLRRALRRRAPELVVHLNRPYRGWTDGLCTTLRSRLPPPRYSGLELELNQRLPRLPPAVVPALRETFN